jgi:hypothetical protein
VTPRSSLAFAAFLSILLLFSGAHADHHKKNKDSDALTECTIESSGGGGGCTVGFKRVCQKLKNGNKCCGCVPDKNAKASTPGGATTSQSQSNTSGQGGQTDSKGTLLASGRRAREVAGAKRAKV